jgi:hypothetical protein
MRAEFAEQERLEQRAQARAVAEALRGGETQRAVPAGAGASGARGGLAYGA